MANTFAQKILKADLEPELAAKFDAFVAKAAGDATLTPEAKDALRAMFQIMTSCADTLKDPNLKGLAELAGVTDATGKPDAAAADEVAAGKADDEDKPKDEATKRAPQATSKAAAEVPAEVREVMKRQSAELEEMRKRNDAIAHQLRKREVGELVRKSFAPLGTEAKVTDLVMDLEAKGIWKKYEPMLAAWSAQLAKSKLFDEVGVGGEGEGSDADSPMSVIEAEARKIEASSGGKLSYEQAFEKAYSSRPDVRREVMQTRKRARG